ncbi:MAG: ACT domain-containing protein [Synechococcus sp.]
MTKDKNTSLPNRQHTSQPPLPKTNVSGINNLNQLLAQMQPSLQSGEFVFCTVGQSSMADWQQVEPLGMFREAEGLSLIVERDRADAASLRYASTFRLITLAVHSSLEAVGLTAAVSRCLAEQGISANVVAAYHHDHIFVPSQRAEEALESLGALSARGE